MSEQTGAIHVDERSESDGRCRAVWLLGRCIEPTAMRVRGACRHEHVADRDLCADHGADVLRPDNGAYCGPCREAGHDCPTIGVRL